MLAGSRDHDAREALRAKVNARQWYHTLELAPGIITPGFFDTRPVADKILPRSCAGMRCLDIGTFDGFWAFEMERRGADEVVGIDILDESRWDWPALISDASLAGIERRKGGGSGFSIARECFDSQAKRVELSIYDLDPNEHGQFDLVFLGSLLHHLRDPVQALSRVRSVCRGWFAAADAINLALDLFVPAPVADIDGNGRPCWWRPNRRALSRMFDAAGFEIVSGPHRYFMPPGPGMPRVPFRPHVLRTREGRELLAGRWVGSTHARVLARPLR